MQVERRVSSPIPPAFTGPGGGYSVYDALIVSAALGAGCKTLYSEDLQDGQIINRQLTIRNPFR